jgi:hypothetical protein
MIWGTPQQANDAGKMLGCGCERCYAAVQYGTNLLRLQKGPQSVLNWRR